MLSTQMLMQRRRSDLLDHDAVDAHVFVTPGEVEQVDPAESETHH